MAQFTLAFKKCLKLMGKSNFDSTRKVLHTRHPLRLNEYGSLALQDDLHAEHKFQIHNSNGNRRLDHPEQTFRYDYRI